MAEDNFIADRELTAEFVPEQSASASELLERRIFLIYLILSLVTVGYGLIRETDGTLFSDFEDYCIFFLTVASILVFVILRKKKENIKDLSRANRIATVLALLSLVLAIYGIWKEIRAVYDWQDEFPSLFFGIFLLVFKTEKRDQARNALIDAKGGSKELRAYLSQDFTKIPLWALNADHHFLSRKLQNARDREKSGKPSHKRYSQYQANLEKRLSMIEEELERRKELGE
jgi:hypothetical protein